ncbi:MAG TPA: RsiV family protein [Pyrinomonadaceae bacterium]
MRKIFFLMISLTLSLSLVLLPQPGSASQSSLRQSLKAAPALPSALAPRSNAAAGFKFVKRLLSERNRRLSYTINASYPQIIGATDAKAVAFNQAVRETMTREVNGFKKELQPPDPSMPAEIRMNTFDASYAIEYSGPDVISVSFGLSAYNAGAAHPSHYSMTLNYDLNAGRALALSDLFNPRSGYMQAISAYAVKALKKELGPDSDSEWIATGAAPSSENYKSWNISRRGLIVTFDPYQVASYADGEHIVVIPYAALRNVIRQDGPLSAFTGKGPR